VTVAAVQRVGKGTSAASVAISSGDGWATPTAGNLLVVTANSDALVTITNIGTAWTAGPSVVDGNGTYLWWKISQGTESTITCTPSVSDTICITTAEYSGLTASPFDDSNSSTIASSAGNTTTSTSVTTTAAGDLVIAAALIHIGSGSSGGDPTGPSWTNSFVNQISTSSGNTHGSADCYTFYSELVVGAAGAYSTSATWTGNVGDRQQIIVAFKAAATVTSSPSPFLGPGPGRIAPSGRWTQFPFDTTPSAQTFTQNLTGSVSPDGALAKAVTKPGLAGTVTPAGALAKQANKALAGSVTPSGVLAMVKVVLRSFAGAITPSGALAKQANKALTGSVTSSGALTRQAAKALAGTLAPAGTLAKAVSKALAGSATPSGALSTIKVVIRSFAGAITPSGTLTRQAQKGLSGASAPSGSLRKAVSKALAAAVSPVGVLAKLVAKPFAGSVTPAGSVATAIPQATAPGYLTSMTTSAGTGPAPTTAAGQSTTTSAGGG